MDVVVSCKGSGNHTLALAFTLAQKIGEADWYPTGISDDAIYTTNHCQAEGCRRGYWSSIGTHTGHLKVPTVHINPAAAGNISMGN